MDKTTCYAPVKGLDDAIAKKLGGTFNSYRVATLRGMYDETHETPLDVSDLDKAAAELAEYRNLLKRVNNASMNSIGTNLAPSFQKLRKAFTAEERFNRVNMIAAMFSAVIDEAQKHNPQLSRQVAVEGYTSDGQKRMGEFFIFEKVYDQILHLQAYYKSKGEDEKAAKFVQILENWSALTAFARMRLRDTEGVKLGNKLEFADETTELNYGDNDMTQLFNAEESTREHWTTTNGMESAFGGIGKQVRRLLSELPVMELQTVEENGMKVKKFMPKRDDLGFKQTLDPVRVHQTLSEILRGVTSESQMMGALKDSTGKPKLPWMAPIIDTLEKNPALRTQFFVDLKKNFQPYSILIEDRENSKGGLRRWKTKLLNRVEDLRGGAFMSRVLLGRPLNPKTSVFDTQGNINYKNLQKVVNDVKDWLYKKDNSPLSTNKFFTRGGSIIERRDFLSNTLEALGIETDADTLNQIMRNTRDISKLTTALENLVQHGIAEDQLKKLSNGESMSYKAMVKQRRQNSRKEGPFAENVRKINEIITKNKEGLRLESRARHKDSKGNNITLFSLVTPSFMGDRFDIIQSYVKVNDKAGLKTYLKNEYLSSPFFMRNGVILNKWLEELIKACDGKEALIDSFAAQFDYMRFLGTEDMSFENFTSQQHMTDMFAEFRADREISSKAETALYPVFVLGDSGVSKYIRAKRYDGKMVNGTYQNQVILDGLYNVYRQELERMKLVKATNEWLKEKGEAEVGQAYKLIDNFSKTGNTFTTLQFLNPDHVSFDGTKGKYANMLGDTPTEATVKAAIQAYMNDAVVDFTNKMKNLGMLETKEVTEIGKDNKPVEVERYVNLGRDVSPSNLNEHLSDFFWNTKFATIQQLQLMTIDPAFYKNTKDLQKRYKEIHAPGSVLNTSAIDKYGNRYSEDGIERVVYFDDIEIDAEKTNPEFMEAIAAIHGKDSKIYKKYKKNSLTDGQGYRTLRSYRRVLGMAGQWTDEMQRAYEAIEQLRAEYGYDEKGNHVEIPADKIAEIAKLAVVFQPIKPYMFTHERIAINNDAQALIPVQHKYAEAVLIPELLPAKSKLRDMAYWMDEKNIDLVGSTTIVKVGNFGSTDISQANDATSLRDALGKGYVHQLHYSDYRIQTNVPEHINSSQLFGTQVRKLIMANVKMNDTHYQSYVNSPDGMVNLGGKHGKVRLNGRNLVAFYNSLIVSNILESFDGFNDAIADQEQLSNMLIQNVINNSRESMDNILSISLEDGNFVVPPFEGGLEHDVAAFMWSIFKKRVNKQSIKGGSAVQVSAMGIEGYKEDGGLEYVTDGKGNILYAECEIPFDISYIDENGNEVELDYNDYCNTDGTLKMSPDGKTSLLEVRFPGSTSLLAYRIPTERDYSMLNLKVKRFSQKTAGGTIKVPAPGTTIAGFDFDVDKLYFMRREYKARKKQSTDKATDKLLSAVFGQDTSKLIEFEEYDFNKSPLDNSRAARNNMLINLIQQRLMDPETMEQRTTPGGFANASRSARIMRELMYGDLTGIVTKEGGIDFNALYARADDENSIDPEPNYDPSDPMTIITYNQQNQVASKLIGIFANHNTNHAFASLMSTFRILKPIEFAGHSYGDGRFSDFLHAPEGVNVDLNVAEFLSASVDAVKDPVLNFMNLNTITADAGAVLARIGYNTTEIGALFNQPIIREACEYCFNNNVGIDAAIRDLKDKYQKAGATIKSAKDPFNPANLTLDALAKNILNDRVLKEKGQNAMDRVSFATKQFEILDLFSEIAAVADDVSQFVTSTKFTASNAVGSTFGDLYAQQMKVDKYLKTLNSDASRVEMKVTPTISAPISAREDLLNMSNADYLDALVDNPLAYEQAMFDANRRALRAMSKYFPYNKSVYSAARSMMASLTKSQTLDAETINSIHSDMMVYLLASQERSEFNGDLAKNDTGHGDMTTREYYTKWFAKDLLMLLDNNPHLKSMAIFEYMLPQVNEETEEVSVNIQGIGGLAPYVKDEIRESWSALARDEETAGVAKDLFLYNFYKLGFNFSPMSFMNLAPTEVKQALQVPTSDGTVRSYVQFMNDIMANKFSIDQQSFARQYILNHLDNTRFVVETKSKVMRDIIKPLAIVAGKPAQSFYLDLARLSKDEGKPFIVSENKEAKERMFTPVIKLKVGQSEVYYMAKTFDPTSTSGMTYEKMNKLGTKGQSLQYAGDTPMPSSMIDRSTAPLQMEGTMDVVKDSAVEVEGYDRQAAINEIAEKMSKAYDKAGIRDDQGEAISTRALASYLAGQEDAVIKQTVQELRESCVKDGVIVLDKDGNPIKAC